MNLPIAIWSSFKWVETTKSRIVEGLRMISDDDDFTEELGRLKMNYLQQTAKSLPPATSVCRCCETRVELRKEWNKFLERKSCEVWNAF